MTNMFIHNFKYSLKVLLKNRMLIFWTFAFPLILGTFFYLAFSNIESNEKLDIIDIAIVNNDNFNNSKVLKEPFKTLSDENSENRIFNTKYVNEKEAKDLLENNEICGYLIIYDEPKIVVSNSGINETIFTEVTNEIFSNSKMIETIVKDNIKNEIISSNYKIDYEKIVNEAISKVTNSKVNIKDISSNNLSYTMIEYYTLIAMTCLYGGIIGMTSINKNLANQSNTGKRVSSAPTKKSTMIISSALASFIIELIGVALLFLYTIFILHVDYGSNLPLIILLSITGTFAGLSLGIAISCVLKTNEDTKVGIIIAFTMLCCFFSGMMGITMKYVIDKNIPIINKLNPANMITDGFYSLYYYDTLD
ncbi:MAG TPA: hypothetical protein DCE23_03965, partial [Firmicutes bacterium]|nr:hypothetical protein [Bacillota bacterium]